MTDNLNTETEQEKIGVIVSAMGKILVGSGLPKSGIACAVEGNMVATAAMLAGGNKPKQDELLGAMVYDMMITHSRSTGDLHPDACMHQRMSVFFMDAILAGSTCEAAYGADTDDVINAIIGTVVRYLDACARERNGNIAALALEFCDALMSQVLEDDGGEDETEMGEDEPRPTLN